MRFYADNRLIAMTPQNARTLDLLETYPLTGVTALDLLDHGGGYRASARISDLRHLGYNIETERRPGKVARYRLVAK